MSEISFSSIKTFEMDENIYTENSFNNNEQDVAIESIESGSDSELEEFVIKQSKNAHPIWRYLKSSGKKLKCDLCRPKVYYKSTTGISTIKRHFEKYHPIEYNQCQKFSNKEPYSQAKIDKLNKLLLLRISIITPHVSISITNNFCKITPPNAHFR
ncbi:2212_t:CDS:2, partial [Cetraspora pellucida]